MFLFVSFSMAASFLSAKSFDFDDRNYAANETSSYEKNELLPGVYSNSYQSVTDEVKKLNFESIFEFRDLNSFSDFTIENALGRLPAIQVDKHRNINIYGLGYNLHNVTIDGQRMSTTGFGDRFIHLNTISLDHVNYIEFNRVITPDMDADALSGNINIVTNQHINERNLRVITGGGANTRYYNQTGPDMRFSVLYTDTPRDDFSYSFSLSHNNNQQSFETLGIGYGAQDFGNGYVDVIDNISPGVQLYNQNRTGGTLQLEFKPDNISTFSFRGFYNNSDSESTRHRNLWNTGNDWINRFETGETGGQGSHQYDVMFYDMNTRQINLQTLAEHNLDNFNLAYRAGWSQGSIEKKQEYAPYHVGGLNFAINNYDPQRPEFQITNIPLEEDGTVDPRRLEFQYLDREYNSHVDNTLTFNVDVEIPTGLVNLKLGSSAVFAYKDGDFNESRYTYFRRLILDQFRMTRHGGIEVFDYYKIPRYVDPYDLRNFYSGSRPTLILNENRQRENSEIWNYSANEHVYAAYGMADVQIGSFYLMGGIRIERTDGDYDGRKVKIDDFGTFQSSVDTSATVHYNKLFPHFQLGYEFGERLNATFAYSKTMARPSFHMLTPYEMSVERDSTVYRGNPDLSPMLSDNFNLMLNHQMINGGTLGLGLFHKQLSNFFIESQLTIEEGEYEGWREVGITNDREASVSGFEISWYQPFTFLPGFLNDFGIISNYTWSHSDYEIDYRESAKRLPGHSPHVLNVALMYESGRVFSQVSWHWTAESLNSIESSTSMAPSISQENDVYLDRYSDGWKDLSVAFRFRISQQFHFWADASNLLNMEHKLYSYDRDLYPNTTDIWGGMNLRAGIQYDLR